MSPSPYDLDNASSGRRMKELLARQLELYQRLERLSAAQRGSIEKEDSRPLLGLLSERQTLTSSLIALNRELAPFRLRWEDIRPGLLPRERGDIESMLREVGERLKRIIDGDEADALLLAAKKQAVSVQLNGMGAAKRTLAAYGQTSAAQVGVLEGTEA